MDGQGVDDDAGLLQNEEQADQGQVVSSSHHPQRPQYSATPVSLPNYVHLVNLSPSLSS